MAKQADAEKATQEADKIVEETPESAGDAMGATQDPSGPVQQDAVAQATQEGDETKPSKHLIQSKNGTITEIPSRRPEQG